MKKFNWQKSNWPDFTYNKSLFHEELYLFAKKSGLINGQVSQLNDDLQYETYVDLMVSEAINTAQIEGEYLNREDVRSSIRNYLGLSNPLERVADARAEGIAALMIATRNSFQKKLSADILFEWHKLVLHINEDGLGRRYELGKWRTETMEIVSGPIGYEKTHFIAPPPEQVAMEMERFIQWFNQTHPMHSEIKMPGPIRSAIAHIWFESIHPFSDGNGRIGRAISEICLAQDMQRPVLLSLSTEIEANKKNYYQQPIRSHTKYFFYHFLLTLIHFCQLMLIPESGFG